MTCLGTEGRIEKSIEVRDRGTEEEKPGINLGMFTSGKRGKAEDRMLFNIPCSDRKTSLFLPNNYLWIGICVESGVYLTFTGMNRRKISNKRMSKKCK